jgi:hypothetical protein
MCSSLPHTARNSTAEIYRRKFAASKTRILPVIVAHLTANDEDLNMATFRIALNMEYCRSADKSFEAGVKIAAELGYKWIEPMVHTGWELLSEVNYYHSFSMEEDPLLMKEICER